MRIREEFTFSLPRGTGIENNGIKKVSGTMRFMKVKDLVLIQQDARVKENPGFSYVILLSRVVTKLGTEKMINNSVIERLCPEDFAFLVDMVNRINHQVIKRVVVDCPSCGKRFPAEFGLLGEA